MARDLSFVSPMIFLEEDGRPMEFYIKPCSLKKKLLPIIEIGGGTLTSELSTSETVIKLTDPKKPVEGFVSSDFIFDSVEKKFLQDIEDYRIKCQKKKVAQKVLRQQDNENDLNTVNEESNRIIEVVRYEELSNKNEKTGSPKKKLKSKRLKYTAHDDKAILNCIEKVDANRLRVQSNSLWKHMARKKVTKHTWQSMRKHYLDFLHEKRKEWPKGQKTLEIYSAGKRMSSAQESESPRKKSKRSGSHLSRKEVSTDSNSDVEINLLTPRRRKENAVTSTQRKASGSNNDSDYQSRQKALESDDDSDDQPQRQTTATRSKQKSGSTDDQSLAQRALTRRTKKLIESDKDTVEETSGRRARIRRQQKALDSNDDTNDQSLAQRALTRRNKKLIESDKDTVEETSGRRAITRRQQKALDSNDDTDEQPLDRRGMTRRCKSVIESGACPEVHGMTKRQVENKLSESETDDQSLPDNNFDVYSQPVARQVTPVFQLKDKDRMGSPLTKRRYPTRTSGSAGSVLTPKGKAISRNTVSDINSEICVTMATDHQDTIEWDSDTDDFDQRLLSVAKKASFSRSHQESHDIDDKGSEDETSAKDTQEDDEDEFIFRRQNRRKRAARNKNQRTSSLEEKGSSDNHEKTFTIVTRGQSSTVKSPTAARVNSEDQANSTASPSKSLRRGRKTEITQETCSRNLFCNDDNDDEESTPRRTKGKTRKDTESTVTAKTPDYDIMWNFVENMSENYLKVERLPCTQGMTRAQLLHALYVSDGTLEDTENYVKTGKLANGASPWSKAENDVILGNEREAVNTIIKKRGRNSVSERGSFLRGCR